MEYTNEKIEQLLAERKKIDEEIRREIQKEVEKEKARYKVDWKWVAATVLTFASLMVAYNVNLKIFPKTSIWSWEHYFGKLK